MNSLESKFGNLRAQRAPLVEFRRLIEGCQAADLDEFGAVSLAARMENEELIRLLVAKGCTADSPPSAGRTALDIAIGEGNLRLVETLLLLGADPASRDDRLLFSAARNIKGNGVAIAKLLVQHGIDVNRTFETWGEQHLSPLDWAVASLPELAEYLRSVGAKSAVEIHRQRSSTLNDSNSE